MNASLALAARAARLKRAAVAGIIGFLSLLVMAAAVALVTIRKAEKRAHDQAVAARAAENLARTAENLARENTAKAIAAHEKIREQLDIIHEKEVAREAALAQAELSDGRAMKSEEDLARKNQELEIALVRAEAAKKKTDEFLAKERARREQAEAKLRGATRTETLR